MTDLDEVRTLRDTSLRLLPGFWQAREQMDLTIKVLEYFAREAEHELSIGPRDRGPMDREIASHIRVMRHLISAFDHRQQRQPSGGVNNLPTAVGPPTYEPDTVTDYDPGSKNYFFDVRLQIQVWRE